MAARALSSALLLALAGCCGASTSQPCLPHQTIAPAADTAATDANLLRHLRDDRQLAEVVAKIIATGDSKLIAAASMRLIVFATVAGESGWREGHRAKLLAADKLAKLDPTPEQLESQLDSYQLQTLSRLYRLLSALGGEAAADYAFEEATLWHLPLERRLLALELAENLAASGARRHAAELEVLGAELREKANGGTTR